MTSMSDSGGSEGSKRCGDCGMVKPLADFPRNRRCKDGRHTYCRPCHNARGKETLERLYGGSRHYHLTRRYGISAAMADEILKAQGGVCPICREREPAHVDHDHDTGEIRGILCVSCNAGLGSFRDNQDWLRAALDYLQSGPRYAPERRGKVKREEQLRGKRYRGVYEPAAVYDLSRCSGSFDGSFEGSGDLGETAVALPVA